MTVSVSKKKCAPDKVPGRDEPILRKPRANDGPRVWELVAACPPLDRNSMYCNLLQCTDFSDTCVLAERQRELVGWISAYRPPGEGSTLFVWQVAVREDARGMGLAQKLLMTLLRRPENRQVEYLKTTVTAENEASRSLFHSLARCWNASIRQTAGFERDAHFRGAHASEYLITIGPITIDPITIGPGPNPVPAEKPAPPRRWTAT